MRDRMCVRHTSGILSEMLFAMILATTLQQYKKANGFYRINSSRALKSFRIQFAVTIVALYDTLILPFCVCMYTYVFLCKA